MNIKKQCEIMIEHYEMSRRLHEIYEEQAEKHDWDTQGGCKVAFDDLPEANKKTMEETAKKIKEELLELIGGIHEK